MSIEPCNKKPRVEVDNTEFRGAPSTQVDKLFELDADEETLQETLLQEW